MATGTRICKVCGEEYPYCRTERRADIFRWQDVACCSEHGAIYFERVAIARGELPADTDKPAEEKAPVEKKQEREPKRKAKSNNKD